MSFNFLYKFKNKKKQKLLLKLFPDSRIDNNCLYNKNTILEGNNVICGNTNISDSKIGFATVIGNRTNLSNCIIGRFCSIANDVHVQPYTHPTNFVSSYPSFFKTINNYPFGKGNTEFNEVLFLDNGKYIEIGNDVWIGEKVTIRGGVKIGDGAIIGMGAVVVKDVPPFAIVGGVPAKVIKYRFDEQTIQFLIRIKWWNWDIKTIEDRRNEFCDINSFVKKYHG